MPYLVTVEQLPEQPILSIRDRRPISAIPAFMGEAFGALFRHLGTLRVSPTGPPFAIYHAFGPDTVDAEICVPVEGMYPVAGTIHARILPATQVARTVHIGAYEDLGAAYEAVMAWVSTHPFEASGPAQERYLTGPGDGARAAAYRTEVEQPITPVKVAASV